MAEQSEQMLIVVDDVDGFVGYAPRNECHAGDGRRHRAIVVLVYDGAGRILLQKRKHALFDNVWDLAGATHPLHQAGRDESYEESGRRCLRTEWGIELELTRLGGFTYFEREGSHCENEYCEILAGRFDAEPVANSAHAYRHRWTTWPQLQAESSESPSAFTPWCREAVVHLSGHEFLANLIRSA